MLPPRILGPQPGELILDLCAARAEDDLFAQLMGNRGLIVANDVKAERIGIPPVHLDRLGSSLLRSPGIQARRFREDDVSAYSGRSSLLGRRNVLAGLETPVSKDSNAQVGSGSYSDPSCAVLRSPPAWWNAGLLDVHLCAEENEAVVTGPCRGAGRTPPDHSSLAPFTGLISWEEMDFSSRC